jgi:glycogen synthase
MVFEDGVCPYFPYTPELAMKVVYMTREYPPHVYGGAGVHVEHLAREMCRLAQVEVKCFGNQDLRADGLTVRGYPYGDPMFGANPQPVSKVLAALLTCLRFTADPLEADVVHCHTWYAAAGGILGRLGYGIPLVVTVHSLEPYRPWKREQLGHGYVLSAWLERTVLELADAVIAVSSGEKERILTVGRISPERVHVIPNGIDTEIFKPVKSTDALERHGIDPSVPYVLFLGRISRQKGIIHFLDAVSRLDSGVGVVMCAASPDTPELEREVEAAVAALRARRPHVVWIREMVPREEAVQLYSHAALFCCPSVYEPFGIINLEAMACETPVVASAVGGIPDVVVHGETGLLVPFEATGGLAPEPAHPEEYARALAEAMGSLLADGERLREMGRRGRERVVRHFGWDRVASRVMDVYREVIAAGAGESG